MAAPGRGRGESKKVSIIDEVDPRIELNRQEQMESARILGIPESEIPIRGRGGFRQVELRTIPPNVTQLRANDAARERQVDVLANFVQIVPMNDRLVHMYRIDYEPAVESTSLMRFLFRQAAGQVFARMPIFDGAHECRTGQRLQADTTSAVVQDAQNGNRQYTVKIVHTGTSKYGPEMLRIYNMHMKDFLRKLGYYSPQPGLFVHRDHAAPVGPEIMMLRGFRTSANEHDGHKMLMNLEGAHKLLQRKSVLEVMAMVRQRTTNAGNLREALRSELVGKIVVASYNQRAYRVEDVEFGKRPTATFERNGQQITFIEYYQTVHNKPITDNQQPLLKAVPNNVRRRGNEESQDREILLVPELCNIAGLTGPQQMDNRLKMDLIRASQIPPNDRVKHIRDFLRAFHNNEEVRQALAAWGYNYGTDAVQVKAHVVGMTGFAVGNSVSKPLNSWPRADQNTADIRVNELAVAPEIKKMAILVARIDAPNKSRMLSTLKQAFDKVGLKISSAPHFLDMERDTPRDYIENIRNVPKDCDMALVFLHGQNKERYDAVKKAASVERGLITQVVTARLMTDEKKARSAAQKIAVQIAAKVGGEPWWVDIPMKKTMVCGYDTYHDTAQRGRSYGAFVASLNSHFARWWSKADAHDRLDEISAQVAANITEAMRHYRGFNGGEVPERVIIYRDGVGEGQTEHVYRVEVAEIKKALDLISDRIKLTFIIVNKRIGARFYMRSPSDGSFSNPPPGTVIDHTVTRQERYDFYLISQSTRQGTVTPTYYNIVHDEGGFPPEIHQRMAFKMCLLYYNWMGTVRVPAPCQYAHKLALLCGEHLHAQPNAVMDDKLHFL